MSQMAYRSAFRALRMASRWAAWEIGPQPSNPRRKRRSSFFMIEASFKAIKLLRATSLFGPQAQQGAETPPETAEEGAPPEQVGRHGHRVAVGHRGADDAPRRPQDGRAEPEAEGAVEPGAAGGPRPFPISRPGPG